MHLKARRNPPSGLLERHEAITALITITITITIIAIVTLAPSRSLFRIPPEISLNNNNFYTSPPRKSTAFKESASSTP